MSWLPSPRRSPSGVQLHSQTLNRLLPLLASPNMFSSFHPLRDDSIKLSTSVSPDYKMLFWGSELPDGPGDQLRLSRLFGRSRSLKTTTVFLLPSLSSDEKNNLNLRLRRPQLQFTNLFLQRHRRLDGLSRGVNAARTTESTDSYLNHCQTDMRLRVSLEKIVQIVLYSEAGPFLSSL